MKGEAVISVSKEKEDEERDKNRPWYHGNCYYRDYELRIIRFGDRVIETSFTFYDPTVGRWLHYINHDHRKRRHPLLVSLAVCYGRRDHSSLRRHGRKLGPRICTVSLCLGGSHCLIYYDDGPRAAVTSLIDFLGDSRLTVVGVGIRKAAAKLRKEWGVRVANPMELTELAAKAFGKEKVFDQGKKKKKKDEGLGLEEMAELVLDGMKVEKKPANVTDGDWSCDLTDDQMMYATSDVFLSFEIGRKCLDMAGGRT